MANTASSTLVSNVRARCGRSNDSSLITTAFVLAALNEAQIHIVRKSPGLLDLDVSNTTSFQISTDDTEVDISSINPAHIQKIWILNGEDTRVAGLKYLRKDKFFEKYIRVEDQSADEPWEYTRQGSKIIFNCPVSSDYNGLYLRIDYTKWATALDGADGTSDLSNSDEGLQFFAQARCFDEISLSVPSVDAKAIKVRTFFNNWLEEYQDYNTKQIEELYDA